MRETEDISGRQVAIQREQDPFYRESARILIEVQGYSDALFDLISAHAKARAEGPSPIGE